MGDKKKYTIEEFATIVSHRGWEFAKKYIEIKTYLPVQVKIDFLQEVVNQNTYKHGYMTKCNSVETVIAYTMAAIAAYTDLIVTLPVDFREYDLVRQNNIDQKIFEEVGDDYAEFSSIHELLLCESAKNNTIEDIANESISALLEAITPLLGEITKKVEAFDENKLLTSIVKMYMNNK